MAYGYDPDVDHCHDRVDASAHAAAPLSEGPDRQRPALLIPGNKPPLIIPVTPFASGLRSSAPRHSDGARDAAHPWPKRLQNLMLSLFPENILRIVVVLIGAALTVGLFLRPVS